MPNPWTGKGNPYTRLEVVERLHETIRKGEPVIAAGAGTGISAKFIEKGGADLIIIYNSGRFRMAGHGSTAGLMAYGDANAVAMEIGEFEVLPVVEDMLAEYAELIARGHGDEDISAIHRLKRELFEQRRQRLHR